MGNTKSRKEDSSPVRKQTADADAPFLPPIRKCAKFETSVETPIYSITEKEKTVNAPECDNHLQRWNTLPYVALLEVYKHLSNNDKACMGRTCKAWLLPFDRPALWRRGNFRFDGAEDWRALRFALLKGAELRHIYIDCSGSLEERALVGAKFSSVNFTAFLNTLLLSENKRIKTFCARNLLRIMRGASCDGEQGNLFNLLVALVEKQDGIQELDLTNASLLSTQAIYLLASVKQRNGVRVLAITDIVAQIQRFEVATDQRFITLMTSFSALTDLSLCEEYLSPDLLVIMSSALANTLQRMEVRAIYNTRRRPNNDNMKGAWRDFCDRVPTLDLSFIVRGIFNNRNIIKILPPTLNLCRLIIDTGTCLMDLKLFYLHIPNFRNYLYDLDMVVYIGTADDVDYIVKLTQKLHNLRRLRIESPLIALPLQFVLERKLRHYLNAKWTEERAAEYIDVVINGKQLDFTESWYSYFVGWLAGIS